MKRGFDEVREKEAEGCKAVTMRHGLKLPYLECKVE